MKSVKSNNPCLAGRQVCKSPDWIGTIVIQKSYDIVKAHRGELKAESLNKDKENNGNVSTAFILLLPNE